MAPFFDPHMVSPLLDYLREVELYDPKIITKQKIKAMLKTNLIDLIEDEYNRYPDDEEMQTQFNLQKPQLESRRNELFEKIDNEPDDVKLVTLFFSKTENIDELRSSSTLNTDILTVKHGITLETLETYYKYAKFKYECGIYQEVEEMLGNFLSVVQPGQSSSLLPARWGRLACRILQAKWDLAAQDLAVIKEAIDVRNVTAVDQLKQRAWLLHWALFVLVNQREGVDALADFFSEKVYLQTVENLCPWLLRYYAAFIVLSPSRRRMLLRDVLNEVQNMSYLYSDPMTQFLSVIFTEFDFTKAQTKLIECQSLMKNDFFLQIYAEKFMYEARLLICEVYCSINSHVDLVMLSEQLHLNVEETERWMVEIVVNTTTGFTVDAKIDSAGKQAIIAPPTQATYQTIIDKTKELTGRTHMLVNNMGLLLNDQGGFIKAKLAST